MDRTINRLLAIFTAALFASTAAQAQGTNVVSTNEVVRMRVTVQDVATLRGFTGPAALIGEVDSRYALSVRIDACVPALTNLQTGTVVTLAVHSPSLFLGGSADKGKTHEITMPRKRAMSLQGQLRR